MPARKTSNGLDRDTHVHAVRHFSRFYTERMGVLQDHYLRSRYSITEVRVLYEIFRNEGTTARAIQDTLHLDAGYLSRILRRFSHDGLLRRRRSPEDGRLQLLSLTAQGQREASELDGRSSSKVAELLEPIGGEDRERLLQAMHTIEDVLREGEEPKVPYLLRPPRAGDMGWVLQRHGSLYAEEHGWNERFEGLVARILSDFLLEHDARRERSWIAERSGRNVGCVFLVRKTDQVARLRMLLVEPSARNLGIGTRLVAECIAFARQAGYRKLTLWTNDVLRDARRVYERAGFQLVGTEPNDDFGRPTTSETWELDLRLPRRLAR